MLKEIREKFKKFEINKFFKMRNSEIHKEEKYASSTGRS